MRRRNQSSMHLSENAARGRRLARAIHGADAHFTILPKMFALSPDNAPVALTSRS